MGTLAKSEVPDEMLQNEESLNMEISTRDPCIKLDT